MSAVAWQEASDRQAEPARTADRCAGLSGARPSPPAGATALLLGKLVNVVYRLRIYQLIPEHAEAFREFFLTRLLPVQLRHGARLIGRWQTADDRVVAVWEYDSDDEYRRIDAAVRADPGFIAAQRHRRATLPAFFTEREEVLMYSTLRPGDASAIAP